MGVLMQGEVAKEKVYSYFKRPEVGITVSASDGLHTCGDAEACLSSH